MPQGWEWDETLFKGSAAYYLRGRVPYPPELRDTFAAAADLDGSPRLIDVGCGPGIVAVMLADCFDEVVGVDPDGDMLREAERLARERGVDSARWVRCRAEELDRGLGPFRYATFAQSFHWMERERVARLLFDMIEPGGAWVHVNTMGERRPFDSATLPHPATPEDEIVALRTRYLGPVRRAGQGFLRHGTPGDEWGVLREAGYEAPRIIPVAGPSVVERTIDDVVAEVLSFSGSAPHLFGDRIDDFERDLRALLAAASPTGRFSRQQRGIQLDWYRRP